MAQTIWQEFEAKHKAASEALHAHLDKCADCKTDLGEFCEVGRDRINACLRAPQYPAGLDVINAGQCPMQAKTGLACTFCTFGHMTECRAPQTCVQAKCSHLGRYEYAAQQFGIAIE